MFPLPASPLVRIMAAPSEIRRSASPRSRAPHTNGERKACLSTWCSSSAGVSTSLSSMKSTPNVSSTRASTKWPMRTFAITGIDTARWMPSITWIEHMRATPPSLRMSAGTRSSAITAAAPACSASLACSGLVTSMMTPPFSISARPTLISNDWAVVRCPFPFSCTFPPSRIPCAELSSHRARSRPRLSRVPFPSRWQDSRRSMPPAAPPAGGVPRSVTLLLSSLRAGLDDALVKAGRSARAQSLSNHLRQLPHTAADLLLLRERDGEAQPVRRPAIVTKLEARREDHACAHRVRQKVPGIDPARQFHPNLMPPFGRGPARALGHLGGKGFYERVPPTQKRPAHPSEMAVVGAAFHEVRKSGLEHERAAQVGRLLERQNAVDGAPAGRDATYTCAREERFRE